MAVNIGSTVKEVLDEINNGTGGGGGEVGNGTITIKQAGVTKGTFTTNQSGDTTIELANSAVNQIHTTTDGNHPLLFKYASGNTSTTQTTNGTKFSKFGKLSSGHRTGKGQFSFQSQRKAMPKNVQTTAKFLSSHTLEKECSKFSKSGFNNM